MKKAVYALCGILAGGICAETTNTVNTSRIVVTATRMLSPADLSGGSQSVLTSDMIEQAGFANTLHALQSLPGISITQDGGPGQRSTLFLRGAKGNAAKVLINGVSMNDNSAFGGADLAQFPVELIERIEVLRGPQGVVHGADAMAGVINIVTKKGSDKPSVFLNAEGGSYNTWQTGIGVSGKTNGLGYYAYAEKFHTGGFSAYNEKLGGGREDDAFDRETLYARFDIAPTENTFLNLTIQHEEANIEFDSGTTIENGPETDQKQTFISTETGIRLWNEQFVSKLFFGLLDQTRDTTDPAWGNNNYKLQTYTVGWQNNLLLDRQEIAFGTDLEYSEADTSNLTGKKDMHIVGFYAEDRITLLDGWFATVGIRRSQHSEYDGHTTYHADTAYTLPVTETRLRGAYGTGFRSPTLSELYDNSWGNANPNLQPETSEGWEIGFDQPLTENITAGLTYFQTDYDDFITYVGFGLPNQNIDSASTEGIETYLNMQVLDNLSLRTSYTYQDNDDKSAGNGFEIRRPEHQASASVNYEPTQKWNIHLNVTYRGKTDDTDFNTFPATPVKNDAVTLVDLASSYQLTEQIKLFGRINNLLDEDYETVYGYNTARLGIYGGIKLVF
jgi:vitamin B12 transporter